jgi:two-component system chemotaxis response regulator CheY
MVRIEFNRLRFLVIDDNAHMRRILRTLLHGFGAREIYEAEDGGAGLEAFTHYVPDIIITDWAMPIFDGLELTQMGRQPDANANPYVAVIMLTGHSEKNRVTSARRRCHRIPRQADLCQGPVPAYRQRGRQSAPVHQNQGLFRPQSPP